jgi:formate dehydrogenase subunit gamma
MRRPAGTVSRYTPGARANHWLNAIILILLALSGMALFHRAVLPTGLFGGGAWAHSAP